MASITTQRGGNRCIQFVDENSARKTIRLGKCDRKAAESICRHVEALLGAKLTGQPIPRETAVWLAGVGAKLRNRLAAVGLVEAPKRMLLGEFLKQYILSRPDVKPTTLEVWQQPCRNLTDFFGAEKSLRSIATGDCDQFKAWLLTQELAAATVAKRLSFARTFLHVARKHKLIDENPFCEVKIPTANVSLRQRFIDRDMVQKLLDAANPTWRKIIALARYGGLRCPSEVLSLEWRHVDWERGRLTVPSPKTDRYDGKESRTIPLFPELRKYLEEAFELAEPGQTHVIGGDHLAKATRPTG
jgi:integrase